MAANGNKATGSRKRLSELAADAALALSAA
jgi:hypothetical protein